MPFPDTSSNFSMQGLNAPNKTTQPRGRPAQLQTSIQPTGVFPQQQTQQRGNLAAALAIPGRADLFHANQQTGVASSSPMTQWGVGTGYAQSLAEAMMAPEEVKLQHGVANQRNILQGQYGREMEGIGLDRLQQGQQGGLLSMLNSIYS